EESYPGRDLGVRKPFVLDILRGFIRSDRPRGHFFSPLRPVLLHVRKEPDPAGGYLSESLDLPIYSFHWDGGAGYGHLELFSYLWVACRHPHTAEYLFYRLLSSGSMEAFLESGRGTRCWRTCGWDFPVLFAGSAIGQARNELQVCRIVCGSGSSSRSAAHGSGIHRDWHRADQPAGGHDLCERQG